MKNKRKKIILILILLLLTTGCTKNLTDKKNNPVKNEVTGQNLTENILCQPTNEKVKKIYEKNGVKVKKLPTCDNLK